MAVFAIADTHLSLSADKSMELFMGRWSGYVDKLKKNWNEKVAPSDSVVIAGDISWGRDFRECEKDFAFINENLNGIKYIIKGNHDYWWATMTKMSGWIKEKGFGSIKIVHNNAYLCENIIICGTRGWFVGGEGEDGVSEEEMFNRKILNREVGRLDMSLCAAKKIGAENESGEAVAFIHYPPVYGDYACAEIVELLQREKIKRCYFGHIHNVNAGKIKKTYKNINFELISADYLKFTPLKI
ncbi:MAG: metallophosphoesterase [Oscillospiraceae bacterium]|nr:metallophosphoesterase [Oscillospiraceae bacterium]